MSHPPTALIIVPTFNERDNLEPLTKAIFEVRDDVHILVVDDSSPDGTGELAETLAAADPRVHVIHREGKLGLGTAYIAGFKWALGQGYPLVFEMDADFSHQPKYIEDFIRAAASADLVLGCRYIKGGGTENWGLWRRLVSRAGNLYARAVLWAPFHDMTGGFKCFRREVLETIDLDGIRSTGYAFQIELTFRAWRAGFRVAEVPIIFPDRRVGESKMSGSIVKEAVVNLVKLRLDRSIKKQRRRH